MPWEPSRYLAFAKERLRPAMDLLAGIQLQAPASILDLGCGAGNVTKVLAERWPGARITGVDFSPAMLARARAALPAARFEQADLRKWAPPDPVDLVFSNAAFHWLEDHEDLFPQLASWVAPGGCLAVQMPHSQRQPSHRILFELAAESPWRELIRPRLRPHGVLDLEDYHRLLAPLVKRVDLWETTYLHVLEGPDPVAEWFRGSLLVPCLDALPAFYHEAFLDTYCQRVRLAYPPEADGRTLLRFRRMFLVAAC